MAKKKSKKIDELRSTNRELKKSLTSTKNRLDKAQAKLEKSTGRVQQLRQEAATSRAAASRSEARIEKLTKKLDRTRATTSPAGIVSSTDAAPSAATAPSIDAVETTDATDVAATTAVDDQWTVAQLRAEARSRGISGLSNKPKAQLLEALTR